MKQTLTTNEKRLARPLKTLVPLIKKDLKEMDVAAKQATEDATLPFKRSIGEKLIEAKEQVAHGNWRPWLRQNFHLGLRSATLWMRIAGLSVAEVNRDSHLSQSDFIRKHFTPSHGRSAAWLPEVKQRLEKLDVERFNVAQHEQSAIKEATAQRLLALNLIDIGYKVLSAKLHPDKGGSPDAMRRLNAVRSWLKEAAQKR